MTTYAKDAGVWKPAFGKPWVRNAAVWKQPAQGYAKNAGVWKPTLTETLFESITLLGQTANLRLCLDAASLTSYDGSAQVWTDLSGNGVNFNRGTGATSDAADPTFAGTAGALTANEYFSFDGGDYFRLPASNPTWVDNLHKDNALSSCIVWAYPPVTNVSQAIFGTNDLTNAKVGFSFLMASAGGLGLYICRANASVGLNMQAGAYSANAWQMLSYSHDEGGGATASWFGNGSTFTAFNGAVTTPSAAVAAHPLEIGSPGNGGAGFNGRFGNLGRIAGIAIWEGRKLTQAEITTIFEASRGRFGV